MKKMVGLLMLAISITVTSFAQNELRATKPGKIFDLEADYFKRRYLVGLSKGNAMQIEVAELEDLEQLKNIDTLLQLFLQDIALLKDSLSDQLTSKRIDYIIDATGKNKLRIQSFQPNGSSFLVLKGELASLKLVQDTVYITGLVGNSGSKANNTERWYRVGFFVNQLTDINGYAEGSLTGKIAALIKSNHEKWRNIDGRWQVMNNDHMISSDRPAGYVSSSNDYLTISAGVGMQNYKNYFAPSISISATAIFNTRVNKYDFGVSWEPHFMFAKNSAGNLQTFRNDFITIGGGFEPKMFQKNDHYTAHFDMLHHFSLGYLVHRKADFFDAHSFRLGTGAINWMDGKIKLEPVLYFHDFFKGATPGVRFSLNF